MQKRLFYLSDNRLSAWLWRGAKLSGPEGFNADKEGLAGFGDYLALSPDIPIYILVDVAGEEFHHETIPHIRGKDRQTLINRKLDQSLRAAVYRHACPQGREANGRRGDRLLLTGLSDNDLLAPWVERILKLKQPLAGIWSLPLLSQVQAKTLGLDAPHQLLVTRQAATGLRQSYFQQGWIKFSRLTPLSADNMASMQESVSRETARIRQYLHSLRLLPADAVLDVVVCGAPLQPESMNTPLLRYRVFSLEDIIERLGFSGPAVDLTGESLHLHLLGHDPPPQHYAAPEQRWFFRLRQMRAGIPGVSALLLTVAGVIAGQNFDDAFNDRRESEKISRETRSYLSRYQAIKKTFSPTPVTPEQMKGAVELMQAVHDKDVRPERLLALVSRALETSGSLKLSRVKWQVSDVPENDAEKAEEGFCPPPAVFCPLSAGKPFQIAILDGEISPFDNFRNALDNINRFVETLNQTPFLRAVALSMPIDVSPSANLHGGMAAPEKAFFSLKVVLSPTP